ncbi:MAG TPA: hypothetical protein VFN29_04225 [Chiayiivirga sp.]|nr:hypothetical protein [Chiayiivirga sp.]
MSAITCSAPGKLVLAGEYAVLEGAPALALAVDRRARVSVRVRADECVRIHAPQVAQAVVEAVLDADGRLHWRCDDAVAARLDLVAQIHAGLRAEGALTGFRGFELRIDTAGFVQHAHKLGLGSSAALTVSLVAALSSAAGKPQSPSEPEAALARMLALHARWQQGQGSGIDIATSLVGGLIAYQREGVSQTPRVQSRTWPPAGVHCQFLWSGQSTSTASHLQRLSQWKVAEPMRHAACFAPLIEAAQMAAEAVSQDPSVFVAAVDAYGIALQALADASGLEIFTSAQAGMAREARRVGAAFKPCGAGGDIGVLVADSTQRLVQLRGSIMASGMQVLDLNVDACGLQ